MEFERFISPWVSAVCTALICAVMTAGRMKRSAVLAAVMGIAASSIGALYSPVSYPAVMLVMSLVLYASDADAKEALCAAFTSAASACLIFVFVNSMTAPALEAYSYTLRGDFYYRSVHSVPFFCAAAAVLIILLAQIKLLPESNRAAGTIPAALISLSMSLAAVMILHMLFGRLIEYNAKYFKIPLTYSMITGAMALLCCALDCAFIRLMMSGFVMGEKIGSSKEFYLILCAVILMLIFYCAENVILNNYTSFDGPEYKYAVTMLIVLMLITILTALAGVCSYVLKMRAYQSQLEKEMEITEMYRSEIKDMQQNIFDFKHDYMKLYSSMSSFLINEEYDKLRNFFDKNITPLRDDMFSMDEDSASIKFLEDKAVQGLVYSYIIKAKKSGVILLTDIRSSIPPAAVPVIDLNRILGIFLDNAIEQAAENDKTVKFAAIDEEDEIVFIIQNTADSMDIEKMFARGESTKGDGRGRGLAIARKLCASHDEMSMHTYTKNGAFICELYVESA